MFTWQPKGGGGVKPYCLRLSLRQSAIGTYCVGLDIMMAFFYAHYIFTWQPKGGFKPPKPPPPPIDLPLDIIISF